jgi:hypothetical protein
MYNVRSNELIAFEKGNFFSPLKKVGNYHQPDKSNPWKSEDLDSHS